MNRELRAEIIRRYGSQFAFAHALGWHESRVSKVVRGRLTLDDRTKNQWADLLGVRAEQIFREVEHA